MVENISCGELRRRLQKMDSYEYEKLVAALWEEDGYQTTVKPQSGDKGIDVEAIKEFPFEQKVLIQAKRNQESNKIGSEDVRKYATLYQQVPDTDSVVIATTSQFTPEAKELANDLGVKQVDVDSIIDLLKENTDLIREYFQKDQQSGNILSNRDNQNNESEQSYNLEQIKSELEDTGFGIGLSEINDREEILRYIDLVLEAQLDLYKELDFWFGFNIMFEPEEKLGENLTFVFDYAEGGDGNIYGELHVHKLGEYWDYNEYLKMDLESHFDCEIMENPPSGSNKPAIVRRVKDGHEEDKKIIVYIIKNVFGKSVEDIERIHN